MENMESRILEAVIGRKNVFGNIIEEEGCDIRMHLFYEKALYGAAAKRHTGGCDCGQ